jgi:hypothetical protein
MVFEKSSACTNNINRFPKYRQDGYLVFFQFPIYEKEFIVGLADIGFEKCNVLNFTPRTYNALLQGTENLVSDQIRGSRAPPKIRLCNYSPVNIKETLNVISFNGFVSEPPV